MSESKSIAAAKALINARFEIDADGRYFLKNTRNEEYIINCIGDLHQALMDEGHMPMRHSRLASGRCTCGEIHN